MDIYTNFVKVYEVELKDEMIDIENPCLFTYDSNKFCIIDKKDVIRNVLPRFNRNNIKLIFQDPLNNSHYCNDNIIIYPFLEWKSNSVLQPIYSNDPTNYRMLSFTYIKPTIIIKLKKESDKFYLEYYVYKKNILNIMQGRNESKENIIKKIFVTISTKNLIIEYDNSLKNILNNTAILTENENENKSQLLLKDNIKLYNYQLNDINWLNEMKNKIDNNENVITYNFTQFIDFTFGDLIDEQKIPTIYYQDKFLSGIKGSVLSKSFLLKGANIISEMGLGKTLIMLCFLLEKENLLSNQFIKNEERLNCNYFYKRGDKKGKHCDKIINKKKNDLFCTEHHKTPFIDKKVVEFDNLEYFNLNDFIDTNSKKLKTNASIIICPTHLCDQWAKEYYSNFKVSRRILLVVTFDQYNNLTLGDVLLADVIILSYNFLINKQYNTKVGIQFDKIKVLDTVKEKKKFLMSKKFKFTDFVFNNKILDESHEASKMSKNTNIQKEISNLESNYVWNISGTPFADGIIGFLHQLNYISNINLVSDKMNKWSLTEFLQNGVSKDMIEKCKFSFRRNTKESIIKEFSGNIINNTLKKLVFTEPEKNIYTSYLKGHSDKNYNFLVKLCCDPEINIETKELIQNCKTLDEIQKVLLNHNKSKIEAILKKLEILNTNINYLQSELNKYPTESQEAMDLRIAIGNDRRIVTIEKKNYEGIKRTYDYLKNVVDNLQVSDTCPICLDETDKDNLAITKCGHKFCWDCINEYIEESGKTSQTKCPKCNIFIKLNEIFLLKEIEKVENNNVIIQDELSELIASIKSTKIGNIIYYLKNELNENNKNKSKIIIFSQWSEILDKIQDILEKCKIKTTIVKGSVYQRQNAIKVFSDFNSDTNIILLSSKNSASGINLTAANKIVLVEPVYGTIKYRKDIENQAIGRASRLNQTRPIEVIRYIVQDAIEEDIYNSGYSEKNIGLQPEIEQVEQKILEL
jgi:SNF2 family DNA or RNA helicase